MTVPRLELQTALLAIHLKNTIPKQLDFCINETRFRSDSQIVLKYIANNDTRFPLFATNMLNEIRVNLAPEQWHYVPTSQNPVGFCTRFMPFNKLKFPSAMVKWSNLIRVVSQFYLSVQIMRFTNF